MAVTEKQLESLQRLANRAADARDRFERQFRRLSAKPGWNEACDAKGIAPNTNPGDWMC